MSHKRETRPADQSNERVHKSTDSVTHEGIGAVLMLAFFIFAVFVAPRLMYAYLAPLKGWV